MEKYTVLMSVYAGETGERLAASVDSMLRQTVPPEAFVLVCDGPLTAELNAVAGRFCTEWPGVFRVVRLEENRGLGAALNVGLTHCRTEWVARMDSDDIALPDRMERQLSCLARHPELSVLGGQVAEFDRDPEMVTAYRRVPCRPEQVRQYLKRRSPMNHTTVVFRKPHVQRAGGYRNVPGFEDYLLWAAMAHSDFLLGNVPEVVCRMRAGSSMYARRGGLRYFANAVSMERHLRRLHIITRLQFCQNVAARFAGAVLLPPALRRQVFCLLLRDRAESRKAPCLFLRGAKL